MEIPTFKPSQIIGRIISLLLIERLNPVFLLAVSWE